MNFVEEMKAKAKQEGRKFKEVWAEHEEEKKAQKTFTKEAVLSFYSFPRKEDAL